MEIDQGLQDNVSNDLFVWILTPFIYYVKNKLFSQNGTPL